MKMASKKFRKIVKRFVKEFNEDYNAKEDVEFRANYPSKTVFYTFKITKEDIDFMVNIYRGRELPILHVFTWSLLHEIGHLENEDSFEDDTEKVVNLSKTYSGSELMRHYMRLPNEVTATQWAIDYVSANPEKIQIWDKIFTSLVIF